MKHWITSTLLGAVLAGVSATAIADQVIDIGKREFMSKCAVCHGDDGKGEAPYTELLYRAPADLTTLAQRNNGVFPLTRVYEVIDGRELFPVHGTREMPLWGNAYRIEASSYYVDMAVNSERFTRTRILSMIDYIYRMQVR